MPAAIDLKLTFQSSRDILFFLSVLKGIWLHTLAKGVRDFDTFDNYFLTREGGFNHFFFLIVKISTLCSNLPPLGLDIDI